MAHDMAATQSPQPPANPDAQATVNDFLDYTEFFPSDLVRSLTLIRQLDDKYAEATQKVHDLTKTYGNLPHLPANERPDPQTLRREIASALEQAVYCRESSYAEASRLYDAAERHSHRLGIIKRKLQALPQPPSRDPTPAPVSPQTQRSIQRSFDRTPRIGFHWDGHRPTSASRPRDRSRKPPVPKTRSPEPDSGMSDVSDESDVGSNIELATLPKKIKTPKPSKTKTPKTPRVRPPGVMGTNVHSSIAGISTSNALAKLEPPPPDAKPGTAHAPWLRLTEYEMAVLRKQMKKNAIWSPSDTMIRRELLRKGRGREAYEQEKARCEETGEPFLDEDAAPAVLKAVEQQDAAAALASSSAPTLSATPAPSTLPAPDLAPIAAKSTTPVPVPVVPAPVESSVPPVPSVPSVPAAEAVEVVEAVPAPAQVVLPTAAPTTALSAAANVDVVDFGALTQPLAPLTASPPPVASAVPVPAPVTAPIPVIARITPTAIPVPPPANAPAPPIDPALSEPVATEDVPVAPKPAPQPEPRKSRRESTRRDQAQLREQAMRDAQELEDATQKLNQAGNYMKSLFSASTVVVPPPLKTPRPSRKRKREPAEATPPVANEVSVAMSREPSAASQESVVRPPAKRTRVLPPANVQPLKAAPVVVSTTPTVSPTTAVPPTAPAPQTLAAASPLPPAPAVASPVQVPLEPVRTTTIQIPLAPAGPSTPTVVKEPAKAPVQKSPAPPSPTENKKPPTAAAPPVPTAAFSRPRRESVMKASSSPLVAPIKVKTPTPAAEPLPAAATRPRSARDHVPAPKARSAEPPPPARDLRRGSNVSLPAPGAPAAIRSSSRRKPPPSGDVTAGEDGKNKVTVVKRSQGSKNKRRKTGEEGHTETHEDIDPDEPRYCICDDVSFGTMISCDNQCEKEWFHLECVGLKEIPPRRQKWYCPDCRIALHVDMSGNPLPGTAKRGTR